MTTYWIVFFLFAGLAFIEHRGKSDLNSTPLLLLGAIFLTLFIGLRWQIGPDWEPYRDIFGNDRLNSFESFFRRGDPAFYVLIWLVRYVGGSIVLLNLICASIFCYGLTRFCASLVNPWLGFVVALPYLVIVIAMSAVRQSVALGFIMIALAGLGRKSLLQTALWVILGSLFHASAFIIALLLVISYSKNRLYAFTVFVISAVAAYFLLLSTFDKLILRYSAHAVQSGGVAFRLVMNAAPSALLLLKGTNYFSIEKQSKFWISLSLFSLFLIPSLLFIPSSTVIDRLSVYAIPIQLVVLANVPTKQMNGQGRRLFPVLLVVIYSATALATYLTFGTFARFYMPYRISSFDKLFVD
jgi:hypothetical protein